MKNFYRIRIDMSQVKTTGLTVEEVLKKFEETGVMLQGLEYEGHPIEYMLHVREIEFSKKIDSSIQYIIQREIEFMQSLGDYRFPKEYLGWNDVADAILKDYTPDRYMSVDIDQLKEIVRRSDNFLIKQFNYINRL